VTYYVARRGLLQTFDEVQRLGNNGNLVKLLLGLYILVRLIVRSGKRQEQPRRGRGMRMDEQGVSLRQESPFVYHP
jgi:hypothetical protein